MPSRLVICAISACEALVCSYKIIIIRITTYMGWASHCSCVAIRNLTISWQLWEGWILEELTFLKKNTKSRGIVYYIVCICDPRAIYIYNIYIYIYNLVSLFFNLLDGVCLKLTSSWPLARVAGRSGAVVPDTAPPLNNPRYVRDNSRIIPRRVRPPKWCFV